MGKYDFDVGRRRRGGMIMIIKKKVIVWSWRKGEYVPFHAEMEVNTLNHNSKITYLEEIKRK